MPLMMKRKSLIPLFFRHQELDMKSACEGKLRVKECFDCLQSFENCKSPGEDGPTAEFYKTFWNSVGHLLVDSLNYSYDHGELSNTQKQAIIKLIEKKGKDKRYIGNWRPISLINVDAKIGDCDKTPKL